MSKATVLMCPSTAGRSDSRRNDSEVHVEKLSRTVESELLIAPLVPSIFERRDSLQLAYIALELSIYGICEFAVC